jgi:hypothetical protein
MRQYPWTAQTFPFGFYSIIRSSIFDIFVNADKIDGDSIVLTIETTILTTVTGLANDGLDNMSSYNVSAAIPASTFSIWCTGAAGELSTGTIHVLMVGIYQLLASDSGLTGKKT